MSLCSECGSWKSKTLETRRDTRYNWTWRRRRCDQCGHVWSTYEVPATNLEADPINPDGKLERR